MNIIKQIITEEAYNDLFHMSFFHSELKESFEELSFYYENDISDERNDGEFRVIRNIMSALLQIFDETQDNDTYNLLFAISFNINSTPYYKYFNEYGYRDLINGTFFKQFN